LLQKAGATPQEAEDLIEKLGRGDTAGVWQALEAKLAALPEGEALDLDQDEIAALSKALGLDSAQEGRLRSSLGESGAARLSIKDFKAVLAELKTDEAAATADRSAQSTALRDLVADAYAAAREKAGVSAAADRRSDGSGRRIQLLAEAAEDEREAEKEAYRPLSGKSADKDAESQGQSSRLPGTGRSRLAQEAGTRAAADGRERDAGAGHHPGKDSAAADASAGQAKSAARTDDQKAWSEFLTKVTRESSGEAAARTEAAAGLNGEAAAALKAEAATTVANTGLEKFSAQSVLRQVESGIYRNLGEGTKQLSLRLDPPELGKLNLQLTVRGQDVSVVFKAETADAGRVLQENLVQLRQVLENQGLKVSKMEVQTQLAGSGQDSAWSGADRHNEAREQSEVSRALDRMRLLRVGETSVQETPLEDMAARRSHTGLSVVA